MRLLAIIEAEANLKAAQSLALLKQLEEQIREQLVKLKTRPKEFPVPMVSVKAEAVGVTARMPMKEVNESFIVVACIIYL